MSDKSNARKFQRVINKLLPEMNADRQGQRVIQSNIISCIKILNNTLPKEWQFKQAKGCPQTIEESSGGNA